MRSDPEVNEHGQDFSQNLSTIIDYLLAIAGPFVLILLGAVIPLHYAMEEMWKLAVVAKMTKDREVHMSALPAAGIGLLFGFSELILFVMNALTAHTAEMLYGRFMITVPMHGITSLAIFVIGRKGGVWWLVGLVAAIIIHGTFNYLVR